MGLEVCDDCGRMDLLDPYKVGSRTVWCCAECGESYATE